MSSINISEPSSKFKSFHGIESTVTSSTSNLQITFKSGISQIIRDALFEELNSQSALTNLNSSPLIPSNRYLSSPVIPKNITSQALL
jgi:hypothetical protein